MHSINCVTLSLRTLLFVKEKVSINKHKWRNRQEFDCLKIKLTLFVQGVGAAVLMTN